MAVASGLCVTFATRDMRHHKMNHRWAPSAQTPTMFLRDSFCFQMKTKYELRSCLCLFGAAHYEEKMLTFTIIRQSWHAAHE